MIWLDGDPVFKWIFLVILGSSWNLFLMNHVEKIHFTTGRYCFRNVVFFTAENRIYRLLR